MADFYFASKHKYLKMKKIFYVFSFFMFMSYCITRKLFLKECSSNCTEISNHPTNMQNSSLIVKSKSEERKTSYPWTSDPTCAHLSVQLADKNSLPKWALTSFPGSGVTFTRQLIEGVTGIYTGSVYINDPSPVLKSGIQWNDTDDPSCGCTIIDKDHEATILTFGNYFVSEPAAPVTLQEFNNYFDLLYNKGEEQTLHHKYENRGVLLLRNPMDVVFSYRNWLFAGKTGNAPPEAFSGQQWEESVEYVAYAWADHAIRWIEQIKIGTVLFYEKLIGDHAEGELHRLLNVMDVKSTDSKRMQCALSNRNRTDHKRTTKTRKFLTPNQQLNLFKSIHRVQQSLRKKGWPAIPIQLYNNDATNGEV